MEFSLDSLYKDGKELFFQRGDHVYKKYDGIMPNSIFFIKEGLISLKIPKKNKQQLKIYRQKNEFFGIEESYVVKNRIMDAIAEENTILYVWNKSEFSIASTVNWELSLYAIKSLSSFLRILNSEFLDNSTISF